MIVYFIIAVLVLWILPFYSFHHLKKRKIKIRQLWYLVLASSVILTANYFKFSTKSSVIDWLIVSIIPITLWVFIWKLWLSPNKVYKGIGKTIGIISILINIAAGTIGLIGLLFIVIDIKPDSVTTLNNGYTFKQYYDGMIDSSNKKIKVHKPFFYLFEKEIYSNAYWWDEPGYGDYQLIDDSLNGRLIIKKVHKDSTTWSETILFNP